MIKNGYQSYQSLNVGYSPSKMRILMNRHCDIEKYHGVALSWGSQTQGKTGILISHDDGFHLDDTNPWVRLAVFF